MNPTTNSGAKRVMVANPVPVNAISAHDANRTRCAPQRLSRSPAQSVSAAEPSSVAVMIAPIWKPLKPRCCR